MHRLAGRKGAHGVRQAKAGDFIHDHVDFTGLDVGDVHVDMPSQLLELLPTSAGTGVG